MLTFEYVACWVQKIENNKMVKINRKSGYSQYNINQANRAKQPYNVPKTLPKNSWIEKNDQKMNQVSKHISSGRVSRPCSTCCASRVKHHVKCHIRWRITKEEMTGFSYYKRNISVYQGNHETKQKLRNLISTERYMNHITSWL